MRLFTRLESRYVFAKLFKCKNRNKTTLKGREFPVTSVDCYRDLDLDLDPECVLLYR